ncbi:hypothetical protein BH24PSE2_BH24PSE2_23060 [soil metagenome]
MINWRSRLVTSLAQGDAPPVLTRDLLSRFATTAKDGQVVPESTLTRWIQDAVQSGQLQPVHRGLYLNRFGTNPGALADAVPFFHKDAVVSLNTVLGDAGVLNNPSHTVTAVVPIDAGFPSPKLGRQRSRAGTLHFYGLPRRVLGSGALSDRLEPSDRFAHPRATSEKALLDWLYLAKSVRSHRTLPAASDIDRSLLNERRLLRLAKAAQLTDTLKQWW